MVFLNWKEKTIIAKKRQNPSFRKKNLGKRNAKFSLVEFQTENAQVLRL